MAQQLDRLLPDVEIERYHRDGVIPLRGVFAPEWVDQLRAGLARNIEEPTHRARAWDRNESGVTMFWDSQAWQGIPQYRDFILQSPAAELAGHLMGSQQVNFFFDAVFVRSHGSQFETPWHQDEPYWSVDGYDTCTVWMPLVPVKRESALAFVPGSHRADADWKQYDFGLLNPDAKADVDHVDFSTLDADSVPDIDADRERFGVVSWDLDPGDCVVFNSRILHGGSGQLDDDEELRVFTTKWLGDDVRIVFREHGMDPDHSAVMTEWGLKPGDRPGTDLYPLVWSRAT